MKLKTALLAVTLAAFVGAAIASCPNACSGHGSCGNHDRCKCYANWVGGDCSGKLCPYGRSDLECSGRGTCDRSAGTCECADGYSGASCQRFPARTTATAKARATPALACVAVPADTLETIARFACARKEMIH